MNKQTRNRIIDIENVLRAARWEGSWWVDKKCGEIKYKFVVTE